MQSEEMQSTEDLTDKECEVIIATGLLMGDALECASAAATERCAQVAESMGHPDVAAVIRASQ